LKSTTQDHFQHRPTQRVERSTMDLQRTHIFVGEERDLHTTQRDSYVKIQNTSQLQHRSIMLTAKVLLNTIIQCCFEYNAYTNTLSIGKEYRE
jgi:hypothetical protein